MLFTVFIVILSLVIVVGCIVAIIMSTSHGTQWLQDKWERRGEAGPRRQEGSE